MKICYSTLICGIGLFLLCTAHAGWTAGDSDSTDLFRAASEAYSKGDYKAAIDGFETLSREGLSAPLLYNLANSYAQDGQSGKAILNYERALRLEPGDSDIRGNMELLRKEQGLFQEEKNNMQRFVTVLGLDQWTALAVASFVCFALVLLLPVFLGLKWVSRVVVAAACFCVTAVSIFSVIDLYQHWEDGVVVVENARLRVSPFESAASIGTIQEGRVLQVKKSHNDFFLVTDETGRSGWLTAGAFEPIASF